MLIVESIKLYFIVVVWLLVKIFLTKYDFESEGKGLNKGDKDFRISINNKKITHKKCVIPKYYILYKNI